MLRPLSVRARPLGLALTLTMLAATSALADAPSNQIVPDPIPAQGTLNTLNSVVNIDLANGRIDGTGSIVSAVVVNGVGYFCVLTADHVVADLPTTIAFGNSGNPPTNTKYNILPGTNNRGGSTGLEDIALFTVRYGAPDAFFRSLTPFSLATPPATPVNFTQVGYGATGTYNAVTMQYSSTVLDGNKRFIDNTCFGTTAGFKNSVYTYTSANWHPEAPGGGWGFAGGTTFGGDSGSPYLIAGSNNPENFISVAGVNRIVNTDQIFAVHTAGFDPSSLTDTNVGVYLSAADDAMIRQCAQAVPEPSSIALIVLGGILVGAFSRARLRNRAARLES
jgi:hypothetical protein